MLFELTTTFFRYVRKIKKNHYQLGHFRPYVRPTVCMKQLDSRWTDFYEILHLCIFFLKKSTTKFNFHQYLTKITDTLHENRRTF